MSYLIVYLLQRRVDLWKGRWLSGFRCRVCCRESWGRLGMSSQSIHDSAWFQTPSSRQRTRPDDTNSACRYLDKLSHCCCITIIKYKFCFKYISIFMNHMIVFHQLKSIYRSFILDLKTLPYGPYYAGQYWSFSILDATTADETFSQKQLLVNSSYVWRVW